MRHLLILEGKGGLAESPPQIPTTIRCQFGVLPARHTRVMCPLLNVKTPVQRCQMASLIKWHPKVAHQNLKWHPGVPIRGWHLGKTQNQVSAQCDFPVSCQSPSSTSTRKPNSLFKFAFIKGNTESEFSGSNSWRHLRTRPWYSRTDCSAIREQISTDNVKSSKSQKGTNLL